MAKSRKRSDTTKPKSGSYLLIAIVAVCVWLGWAAIANFLVWRGPPSLAAQLSPSSPVALIRRAEEEQKADRYDRAEAYARAGLSLSPFDARGLRILGMSLDKKGDRAKAEPIMTLAGNWSLRDSPTHLWLFEERIKKGEVGSAFAHLDTVLRRRHDLREPLFGMIAKMIVAEPRVLGPLTDRLALNPNWRPAFLAQLSKDPAGRRHAVAIAVELDQIGRPLDEGELKALTTSLLASGDVGALKVLAERLRLVGAEPLRNPGFEGAMAAPPFGWEILGGAGASVEVLHDAPWNSKALRVEHDGLSVAPLARQLIALRPGRYRLAAKARQETGPPAFFWQVTCLNGPVVSQRIAGATDGRTVVEISQGCELQWLELRAELADRTRQAVALFDDVALEALTSANIVTN